MAPMNVLLRHAGWSFTVAFCLGAGALAADGPAPADRAAATTSSVAQTAAPASIPPAAQPRLDDLPTEWVDPDTGHRVVRLSREDNTQSLYFHQNPFTPDGTRLVATIPTGLATINLRTGEIKKFALGTAPTQRVDTHDSTPLSERISHVVVGRKTPTVYYTKGLNVMATNLDTGATRKICVLTEELFWGAGFTINADETLLAGAGDAAPGPLGAIGPEWTGNKALAQRLTALVPMVLYTINIKTGEFNYVFRAEHDWLNHVQFSPTDPTLLMYCHEGTWSQVDRIWQIRVVGETYTVQPGDTLEKIAAAHGTYAAMVKYTAQLTSDTLPPGRQILLPPAPPRLIHQRTIPNEIAGHEFWGADGQHAWYDLQTPQSQVFWVGGMDLATGRHIRYSLPKNEWSVHYNVSPDGKLFAGDGGGPNSVAKGDNGQWIFLFTPDPSAASMIKAEDEDVQTMPFKAERLVNLVQHDYGLEPNVMFTPDMKWIIFRSNLLGAAHGSQVFAVEIAKSAK